MFRVLVSFLTLSLALLVAGCDGQVYEGATYEGPACVDADGTEHGYRMNLTGVNTWGSTTPVIDDGDLCRNAEHAATAQDLLNKVTFLREGVAGKATSFRLRVPLIPAELSGFVFASAGGFGATRIFNSSSGGSAYFAVPGLPSGYGKIVGYGMRCSGLASSVGPHTVLPSTMPILSLYRQPYSAGIAVPSRVTVDTVTDPSATIAAYDGMHAVSDTIDHTIVADSEYYLGISGESGGTGGAFGFTSLWIDLAPL